MAQRSDPHLSTPVRYALPLPFVSAFFQFLTQKDRERETQFACANIHPHGNCCCLHLCFRTFPCKVPSQNIYQKKSHFYVSYFDLVTFLRTAYVEKMSLYESAFRHNYKCKHAMTSNLACCHQSSSSIDRGGLATFRSNLMGVRRCR